ncbi:MAG: DUF3179 domain-containing protein [Armatimonadetes bacterium]|nr:DUF3179 domain-containing protein [Armatimonadota bacterium]
MTRRAGLIVLLASVVLAVLLAWLLRAPPEAGARLAPVKGQHSGALTARSVVPPAARPSTVRRGRLAGSLAVPDGYDVTISAVDLKEILDPARPLEDVRPLETPRCVTGDSPDAPEDDETVIGVVVDGVPRAYPLSVLDYHWAANDVVDGRRVLVVWDPIAGAAAVYEGTIDGRAVEAGASGKWYRANALFYDRESTSLLPAITGRFVTGPLTNRALRPLPFRRESWKAWRERHEATRVLPRETARNAPPAAFGSDEQAWVTLLANAPHSEPPLPLQEWVIGFLDPIGKPICCATKDLPGEEPLRIGRALVERQPDGGARAMLSGGVWPQQVVCRYCSWVYLHQDTEAWPQRGTEAK